MPEYNDSFVPVRFPRGNQDSFAKPTSMTSAYTDNPNTADCYGTSTKSASSSNKKLNSTCILASGQEHTQKPVQSTDTVPPILARTRPDSALSELGDIKLLQVIDISDDESMMDYRYCLFPQAVDCHDRTIEARLAEFTKLEHDVARTNKNENKKMTQNCEHMPKNPSDVEGDEASIDTALLNQFENISIGRNDEGPVNKYNEADKEPDNTKVSSPPKKNTLASIVTSSFDRDSSFECRLGDIPPEIGLALLQHSMPAMYSPSTSHERAISGEMSDLSNNNLLGAARCIISSYADSSTSNNGKSLYSTDLRDYKTPSSQPASSNSAMSVDKEMSQDDNPTCILGKSQYRCTADSGDISQFLDPGSALMLTPSKNSLNSIIYHSSDEHILLPTLNIVQEQAPTPNIVEVRLEEDQQSQGTDKDPEGSTGVQNDFTNKFQEMLKQNGCFDSVSVDNNDESSQSDANYSRHRMHRTWRGVRSRIVASRCSSLLSTTDSRLYRDDQSKDSRFVEATTAPRKSWFKRVHETNQRILRTATKAMFSKIDEFQGMNFDHLAEAAKTYNPTDDLDSRHKVKQKATYKQQQVHAQLQAQRQVLMQAQGKMQPQAQIYVQNQTLKFEPQYMQRVVQPERQEQYMQETAPLSRYSTQGSNRCSEDNKTRNTGLVFQNNNSEEKMTANEHSSSIWGNSAGDHSLQETNDIEIDDEQDHNTDLAADIKSQEFMIISRKSTMETPDPRSASNESSLFNTHTVSTNPSTVPPSTLDLPSGGSNLFPKVRPPVPAPSTLSSKTPDLSLGTADPKASSQSRSIPANSSMPTVWKMKFNQTEAKKVPIQQHNIINLSQKMIPLQVMGIKRERLPTNTHGMYGYL
ncbi:HER113Cp [Eremothecium sinecaudum]|uniref:HER113Cp n=1 Tax=Eremothecium sinecaudum TaxID=45286 RepID=A0A109UZI7_9SACH|nr:HER113Cp [Eremothecium sinecaudum]AMD21392.1 HER113Cp [Eremothecium sinecaudum]